MCFCEEMWPNVDKLFYKGSKIIKHLRVYTSDVFLVNKILLVEGGKVVLIYCLPCESMRNPGVIMVSGFYLI